MSSDNSEAFWRRSWNAVDPARISSYALSLDADEDGIIDFLKRKRLMRVCDAGCGCGIYSLRLAQAGFFVSGFDIAEHAVSLTKKLLSDNGYPEETFQDADILTTGYPDDCFDAVVARDVVDHLPIRHGIAAVEELLRIVRPGGYVLLTLDASDDEYEAEVHETNEDGDFVYTHGKWYGMVFHPYTPDEILKLSSGRDSVLLRATEDGVVIALAK